MRGFFRHPSHDNAGPGIWFLTINTHDSRHLFGEVVDARMQLNALGRIVRDCWRDVPLHFPHVVPDDFIVMPNHMHPIVHLAAPDPRIRQRNDRIEAFGAPVAGSLATIVRSFKAATTRAIRERIGQPIVVWQSRFYDRRIWDQRNLKRAREYIADNPRRWQQRDHQPASCIRADRP